MIPRTFALLGAALLTACGAPEADKLRTVTSYDFSTCDSAPTTDATQLEAAHAFQSEVQRKYFVRRRDSELVANHEDDAAASGVREYEGPFYLYVHPRKLESSETLQGIDWAALVFLHATKVRSRSNGREWSDWSSVRTRNFGSQGRTVEGLGRWKCLLGAEIAWAQVTRSGSVWTVTPLAVSVFDQEEVRRALPVPSQSQIEGQQAVETL
jgi:hypothetical protein